jgi:hypothetical protein
MKKETIFATVFGILAGAIVGGFVLFSTSQNTEKMTVTQVDEKPNVSTQSARIVAAQKQLDIKSPQTDTISNKNSVKIEGVAPKNSFIIAQSPNREVTGNFENGDFSLDFPLVIGENSIEISAYSGNSIPQQKSIKIFYIPE